MALCWIAYVVFIATLYHLYFIMKDQLAALQTEALAAIATATDALKDVEVAYLGKKGKLTAILRGLADLPIEEKKKIGAYSNEVKTVVTDALEARRAELEEIAFAALAQTEKIDVTYSKVKAAHRGTIHPLSEVTRRLEDVFTSLGFEILDGPQVELEEFNFDALNIPKDHPSRDHQDTFWLGDDRVLRSQTSNVWARALRDREFPLRGVSIGRVYRNEALDASHEHTFHQFEGFYVDRNVSVTHMIAFFEEMLSRIFERDVKVRLRPGYFPFVEPGFELDFSCQLCDGNGCSACKHVGWIELLGCGMIHPNVIRMAGKDPEEWNGFAWGGGLERLVMMKHKINDIRVFHTNDLRDLRQF